MSTVSIRFVLLFESSVHDGFYLDLRDCPVVDESLPRGEKIKRLPHTPIKKENWYAPVRKIAYYCAKLYEQPFSTFTRSERETLIFTSIELIFLLFSCVVVVQADRPKRTKYSPQGGYSARFGGGATSLNPWQNDTAEVKKKELKTPSPRPPAVTPGVTVIPPRTPRKPTNFGKPTFFGKF